MIEIRQGEDWAVDGVYHHDLTGYTATSKARRSESDASSVGDFTVDIEVGTGGVFTLSAAAVVTAALPLGALVADIRFVDSGGSVSFVGPFDLRVRQPVTR